MYFLMFFISLGYVISLFTITRKIVQDIITGIDKSVVSAREEFQKLIDKAGNSYTEMKQLEEESAKIFTIYDMTKAITQNFNEEEAFAIFKNKLKERVPFSECLLLDPFSEQMKDRKRLNDYFLFALKGKRRVLGYLALKGMSPNDKERTVLASHQFALALRRIRLYQQIEKSSITDSLTKVYTRRYLLERFQEEIQRSKAKKISLSVLMIDADFFKKINDKYGHLTGDKILCGIADVIRENVREIDIAGRYGGEEFCVVLPDTSRAGTHYVAERIRCAVEKTPIQAYNATINTTVSIGVATFPDDGKIMTELIDKADWALYRAKKTGRNTVCTFGVYKKEK